MNRREALRSLAGGMAAGALAAAGVAVVVPPAVPGEVWTREEIELAENLKRLTPSEFIALEALLIGMVEKRDTSAEILDAIGEERGASMVAALRRSLARQTAQ